VARPVSEQQQRNRIEQARLYGAPLGDLLGEVGEVLALSQARIARLVGLSAPMLSQLASGHRVKIGNPTAVLRLQHLVSGAREVAAGREDAAAVIARLEDEKGEQILTRATQMSPRRGAAEVQHLLRAVATAEEMLAAARLLDQDHPGLAELLRVYGAGRNDQAVAHFTRAVEDGLR
jgi:transcriptional regulator with XRE-family HTH domain